MKRLVTSLVAFALLTNDNALTTVEVVARAKPCVVILKLWNSAHPEINSQGTGFFIAKDKIMTANHVVAGDYDKMLATDLAVTTSTLHRTLRTITAISRSILLFCK